MCCFFFVSFFFHFFFVSLFLFSCRVLDINTDVFLIYCVVAKLRENNCLENLIFLCSFIPICSPSTLFTIRPNGITGSTDSLVYFDVYQGVVEQCAAKGRWNQAMAQDVSSESGLQPGSMEYPGSWLVYGDSVAEADGEAQVFSRMREPVCDDQSVILQMGLLFTHIHTYTYILAHTLAYVNIFAQTCTYINACIHILSCTQLFRQAGCFRKFYVFVNWYFLHI